VRWIVFDHNTYISVIPAKAGIHLSTSAAAGRRIPAFAGMTGELHHRNSLQILTKKPDNSIRSKTITLFVKSNFT
jgi:hypothetical protein